MTPAIPAETFRLWTRKTSRSKWRLAHAGTKAACDTEQTKLGWQGYSDFYLTQRVTNPNADRFGR